VALLEVKNLKKHFPIKKGILSRTVGYVRAVDGISFTLRRGETLGLVGESGCGKTTVGRSIMRLIEPTSGQVNFNGQDLLELCKEELRQVRASFQIIFQDPFSSGEGRSPSRADEPVSSRVLRGPAPADRHCSSTGFEPIGHSVRRTCLGIGRFYTGSSYKSSCPAPGTNEPFLPVHRSRFKCSGAHQRQDSCDVSRPVCGTGH